MRSNMVVRPRCRSARTRARSRSWWTTAARASPADRQRIFEPFLRLDPSRNRERGGAGLGLAISRHLVQCHGGAIGVEDRPGGGARFRVSLPLAAPA